MKIDRFHRERNFTISCQDSWDILDIGVAKIYPKVAQIVTLNVELYWTNTSHGDGILSVGPRHLHFCVWLFSFYNITALLVGGGH